MCQRGPTCTVCELLPPWAFLCQPVRTFSNSCHLVPQCPNVCQRLDPEAIKGTQCHTHVQVSHSGTHRHIHGHRLTQRHTEAQSQTKALRHQTAYKDTVLYSDAQRRTLSHTEADRGTQMRRHGVPDRCTLRHRLAN